MILQALILLTTLSLSDASCQNEKSEYTGGLRGELGVPNCVPNCRPGTYFDQHNWSPSSTIHPCTDCPAGTKGPTESRIYSEYAIEDIGVCTACGFNETSTAGSHICTTCGDKIQNWDQSKCEEDILNLRKENKESFQICDVSDLPEAYHNKDACGYMWKLMKDIPLEYIDFHDIKFNVYGCGHHDDVWWFNPIRGRSDIGTQLCIDQLKGVVKGVDPCDSTNGIIVNTKHCRCGDVVCEPNTHCLTGLTGLTGTCHDYKPNAAYYYDGNTRNMTLMDDMGASALKTAYNNIENC